MLPPVHPTLLALDMQRDRIIYLCCMKTSLWWLLVQHNLLSSTHWLIKWFYLHVCLFNKVSISSRKEWYHLIFPQKKSVLSCVLPPKINDNNTHPILEVRKLTTRMSGSFLIFHLSTWSCPLHLLNTSGISPFISNLLHYLKTEKHFLSCTELSRLLVSRLPCPNHSPHCSQSWDF